MTQRALAPPRRREASERSVSCWFDLPQKDTAPAGDLQRGCYAACGCSRMAWKRQLSSPCPRQLCSVTEKQRISALSSKPANRSGVEMTPLLAAILGGGAAEQRVVDGEEEVLAFALDRQLGVFVDAAKPAVKEMFDEALAPETRQAAQEPSFDRREVAKGMLGRVPASGIDHFLVEGRVSTQVAHRPDSRWRCESGSVAQTGRTTG